MNWLRELLSLIFVILSMLRIVAAAGFVSTDAILPTWFHEGPLPIVFHQDFYFAKYTITSLDSAGHSFDHVLQPGDFEIIPVHTPGFGIFVHSIALPEMFPEALKTCLYKQLFCGTKFSEQMQKAGAQLPLQRIDVSRIIGRNESVQSVHFDVSCQSGEAQ